MPNVMFKRGTQAALNTLKAGSGNRFTEGTFYLTSDTDRLYVAQSATELVELNKSIEVVSSISNLPNGLTPATKVDVGQFYYISGTNLHDGTQNSANGNILVVCTSVDGTGKPTWTQVNPDTNTNDNDHVVGFSVEKDEDNSVQGSKLVYKWKIEQEDINNNALTDLTGSFEIVSADISQLAGASVGLQSSAPNNNSVTLSTKGDGSGSGSVTITGTGGNITVSGSANAITLSAIDTTYSQVVDGTNKTISLEKVGGNNDSIGDVVFADGTATTVSVVGSNSNKDATVTVNHADVSRSADSTTNSGQKAAGAAITYVTGITSNSQGHITAVSKETINLPQQTTYAIDNVSADDQGQITVSLNGTDTTSGQDLYYVVNGTTVYNQGTIDFYTKQEIDNKINGIDSMTYKGTVGTGGTVSVLPGVSDNVKIGDTYKVSVAGTYANQAAKVGDLFIATGTEAVTNGIKSEYITSNLAWTYVPSGDEFDSQYDLSISNNIITLSSNISGDSGDDIEFIGGNKIGVSTDASASSLTINHDSITTNGAVTSNPGAQTLNYGQNVTIVRGVKADGYGHITDVYTSTLAMPAAPTDTKESLAVTASTATTDGKIALDEDNTGNNKGEITFSAGTLTTATVVQGSSTSKGTVSINHSAVTTTPTDATSSGIVMSSNNVDAITAVTTDGYGHLTGYTTSRYVLPDQALTTLSGAIASTSIANALSAASVGFSLNGSTGEYNAAGPAMPEFTLSSKNLSISITAATAQAPANIDLTLEWGSF